MRWGGRVLNHLPRLLWRDGDALWLPFSIASLASVLS